jgi:hypothetical protein
MLRTKPSISKTMECKLRIESMLGKCICRPHPLISGHRKPLSGPPMCNPERLAGPCSIVLAKGHRKSPVQRSRKRSGDLPVLWFNYFGSTTLNQTGNKKQKQKKNRPQHRGRSLNRSTSIAVIGSTASGPFPCYCA